MNPPKNRNYCGVVVALNKIVDLPGCDNVKGAFLFGNQVIVGKDAKPGDLGVFFPVETALSREFLSANNLYRKAEWGNVDPLKTGYFEEHGRIKAVKFRGHRSEGFWVPISFLDFAGESLKEGDEFDELNGIPICTKYVPRCNVSRQRDQKSVRLARAEDRILPNQFRLHYDTDNLRRNIHRISPYDYISISEKWHGTSAVFAHILVTRELKWYEKVLKRFGVQIKDQEYEFVWSSRRVIKGIGEQPLGGKVHFYGDDVWGQVAEQVRPKLPKGFTVYGEIVGYTQNGTPIQKDYTYGQELGTNSFMVYRVTYTNEDGKVFELPWLQMLDFCFRYEFKPVVSIFYGMAEEYERGKHGDDWGEKFLETLEGQIAGRMCRHNDFKVPAEGVVVRIDRLERSEAYKLKSFAFLERESKMLDKGELDMETVEAETIEV